MLINDLKIEGYEKIRKIHSSGQQAFFDAIRIKDKKKVLLKTALLNQKSLNDIALIQHEFNILQQLGDVSGTLQAHDLIHERAQVFLVLEHASYTSLDNYLSGHKINLDEFFTIALQLVETLGQIHTKKIIHKDVKPDNILISTKSKCIKLINFNFASDHDEEQHNLNPHSLGKSLQHMSPEQTGRINRVIDHRTDFYSLGITFYEMLTGDLPFHANDPLEWIHSHIAKSPPLVHQINPVIPEQLSLIINKLLGKAPEDRYASAYSLKIDLEICQNQWQQKKKIDPFKLNQHDVSNVLLLSQKLYGRESELKSLLSAFTETCQGNKEVILISGSPGIGKTSLIKELYKPVVEQKGIYISGKYDQIQNNQPYSVIIRAFNDLITSLLAEPEYKLNKLRTVLNEALGSDGQLIVDILPDIEIIIGKQKEVHLNYAQRSERFQNVLQRFIRAFASADHPLVLFLDDIQWSDSASLNFLEILLKDDELKYFLLIGAYRDTEVDGNHLLQFALQNFRKSKLKLHEIKLKQLSTIDVQEYLADSLHLSMQEVSELGNILSIKTQNNPFYLNEVLKKFYTENLLYFSHQERRWRWNLTEIIKCPIATNVVSFLISKIDDLNPDNKEILMLGSCIGYQFDLITLAQLSNAEPYLLENNLTELIRLNYITPINDQFKNIYSLQYFNSDKQKSIGEKIIFRFTHDHLQQASYEILPTDRRIEMHLKIARRLLQVNDVATLNVSTIFTIVSHYNLAYDLVVDPQEQNMIANFNLTAAKNAKKAIAYEIAINHLHKGILFLEKSGEKNSELLFKLYKELAECEYITNKIPEAEAHFQFILDHTTNRLDRAKIYLHKIDLYTMLGKHQEAIVIALDVLKNFGIKITQNPNVSSILKEYLLLRKNIYFNDITNISESLPKMVISKHLIIDKLLNKLLTSVYFKNRHLMAFVLLKSVNFNFKHGYSKYTSSSFLALGATFIIINQYTLGMRLVKIAQEFAELYNYKVAIPMDDLAKGIFVNHWFDHSNQSENYLRNSYQTSVDIGDINFMVYSRSSIPYIQFYSEPLGNVHENIKSAHTLLTKLETPFPYYVSQIVEYYIAELLTVPSLISADTASLLTHKVMNGDNYNYTCLLSLFLSRFHYLRGEYNTALHYIKVGFKLKKFHDGTFNFTQGYIMYVLCITACWKSFSFIEKIFYRKKLNKLMKQLRTFTKRFPTNFEHNLLLAEAEVARIRGHISTGQLYDASIEAAQKNNYIFYQALANECAANFYFETRRYKIANFYLQESLECYQSWGALSHCEYLTKKFKTQSNHLVKAKPGNDQIVSDTPGQLNISTLVKSMQAISSEINIENLLSKLMQLILENGGAEHVKLLINQNGKFYISAEGSLNNQILNITTPVAIDDTNIPIPVISYIQRTLRPVIIEDAFENENYNNKYIINNKIKSILALPILHENKLRYIVYLENNKINKAFSQQTLEFLSLIATQAAISLENAKFYNLSNRFVPYALLNRLNRDRLIDVNLGDQSTRTMSILFLDIQGYTSISEKLTPKEIFQLVSDFLGGMEPIISKFNGFIDKFIGDAIMALFDDPDDALNAAIHILNYTKRFNELNLTKNKVPLNVGIGINTGEVILGIVGHSRRMAVTVIGDSVNVAARVEALTRPLNCSLLITDETKNSLKNPEQFKMKVIHDVSVKGKEAPINVWQIKGYGKF